MTEPARIAQGYLDVWNETDAARRRALMGRTWSADATFVDPMMRGQGHGQIDALIAATQTRYPGHCFTLIGTPDGHGNYVRFRWTLAPEGGATLAEGTDFVTLTDGGLLRSVTGFLDVLNA